MRGELADRCVCDGWEHDFADEAGGLDAAGVVDEGEAFVVSRVAFGGVGGDDVPVLAELLQKKGEGGGVAVDLLHGNDIQAGDHLGNEGDRTPVTFGGVGRGGLPGAAEIAEHAQVPAANEEIVG
ncbi:hypothetical protein [Nocardia gipuzkoensis]